MLLINDAAEQFALLKQSNPKNHVKRRGYFCFELNLVFDFREGQKSGQSPKLPTITHWLIGQSLKRLITFHHFECPGIGQVKIRVIGSIIPLHRGHPTPVARIIINLNIKSDFLPDFSF